MTPPLVLRDGPETVLRRVHHPTSARSFLTKSAVGFPDRRAPEWVVHKLKAEYQFAAAACRHERLLAPLDWDPAAGVITYSDAQCTLAQLVRQEGRLAPPVVARVLHQCLQALDHLHKSGFAHGTLTADGVFVTPDGDAAVGDFVGYRYDLGRPPVRPEYPVRYRAPELIDIALEQAVPARDRAAGVPPAVRADLYSVGYLALQLLLPEEEFVRLFGLDPAPGAADANWDGWHGDLSRPAPRLDEVLYDVPAGLRDAVRPLIQKPPAERARLTVAGVIEALAKFGLRPDAKLPEYGRTREEPPPRPVPAEAVESTSDVVEIEPDRPREKHDRVFIQLADETGLSRTFRATRAVVVGRNPQCDLVLPSAGVSSRHAILIHRGGAWWAYDLRSNEAGTWVGGASAANGVRVRSNQRVRFGDVERTATVHRGFWFGRGRFLVTSRLHAGQSGVVYRAMWAEKRDADVAVKVFPEPFQSDAEAVRRFLRSIPDAGRFRHPNIVSVYQGGFKSSAGKGRMWYIAMRYMPRGSLRDRLKGRPRLDVADVIQLGSEIGEAVRAIAEQGIVHRNINPACVLFDDKGAARLGDFLLCRREDLETMYRITRAGDQVFTNYAYHAPELLRGDADLTWHVDQYGLTACLYEALAGRPAVRTAGRTLPQILTAAAEVSVPPARTYNPAVPPALDEFLLRGLAKRPADRFPTPDSYLQALRDLG